jgi:hypothetical protein
LRSSPVLIPRRSEKDRQIENKAVSGEEKRFRGERQREREFRIREERERERERALLKPQRGTVLVLSVHAFGSLLHPVPTCSVHPIRIMGIFVFSTIFLFSFY